MPHYHAIASPPLIPRKQKRKQIEGKLDALTWYLRLVTMLRTPWATYPEMCLIGGLTGN